MIDPNIANSPSQIGLTLAHFGSLAPTTLLQNTTVLVAVISAVVATVNIFLGFVLGQVSGLFTDHKESKKAARHALTELLDVRFRLFGVEALMDRITGSLNVAEHEKSQIRVFINSVFPKWEEAHSRYDTCVTTLSGLDPLLASTLRSKDATLPLLNWMHSMMGQNPTAASIMGPVLNELMKSIEPALNDSILRLARKCGWICWFRTWRSLRRGDTATEKAMKLLQPTVDSMKSGMITGNIPKPQNPNNEAMKQTSAGN